MLSFFGGLVALAKAVPAARAIMDQLVTLWILKEEGEINKKKREVNKATQEFIHARDILKDNEAKKKAFKALVNANFN